jgi:ABC-type sugar transport system permease subunit
MTEGSGSSQTEILVTRVYRTAFSYFSYGNAAATSVIIFLMLAAFSTLFVKITKGDKGVYD